MASAGRVGSASHVVRLSTERVAPLSAAKRVGRSSCVANVDCFLPIDPAGGAGPTDSDVIVDVEERLRCSYLGPTGDERHARIALCLIRDQERLCPFWTARKMASAGVVPVRRRLAMEPVLAREKAMKLGKRVVLGAVVFGPFFAAVGCSGATTIIVEQAPAPSGTSQPAPPPSNGAVILSDGASPADGAILGDGAPPADGATLSDGASLADSGVLSDGAIVTDGSLATDGAIVTDGALPDGAVRDRTISPALRAQLDSYSTRLAQSVCAKLTTCCSTVDMASFTDPFREAPYNVATPITAANCTTTVKQAFDTLYLTKWGGSVAIGNIVFDEGKGNACIARVASSTCGVATTAALFDQECFGLRGNKVFRKVAPIGSSCIDLRDATFFGECDPAAGFCNELGVCSAWRRPGESCGIVPQPGGTAKRLFCATNLSCEGQTATMAGRCSSAPVNVALGAVCSTSTGPLLVCPAGAYCDFAANACKTKLANGVPCQNDDESVRVNARETAGA